MSSKLHSKLDQLEHRAMPLIERIQERRAYIEGWREYLQPDVEQVLALSRYCGLPASREDREQLESDMIETILLAYWYLDNEAMTHERLFEAVTQANIRLCRELFGCEITHDELDKRDRLIADVREDMRAGIPAGESAAARAFVQGYDLVRRLKKHTDAMTAYLAGGGHDPDRMQ